MSAHSKSSVLIIRTFNKILSSWYYPFQANPLFSSDPVCAVGGLVIANSQIVALKNVLAPKCKGQIKGWLWLHISSVSDIFVTRCSQWHLVDVWRPLRPLSALRQSSMSSIPRPASQPFKLVVIIHLLLTYEWVKFPGKTKKGGVIIPDDNITW